jgi:Raf kinase inhibitor-like YbhB/YbcL family protein
MRSTRACLLASLLVAACGGGDDSTGDDDTSPPVDGATSDSRTPDAAPPDGPSGAFTLTSTALTEGGMFPDQYTCSSNENMSPPLAWNAHPEAQSYAVVFKDNTNGYFHWVIWDIASELHALPEAVENAASPESPAGAKQVRSYDGDTYGYLGPCPGSVHTYEFTLHALDVATLPDVATSDSLEEAAGAIEEHSIATATLSAMSD